MSILIGPVKALYAGHFNYFMALLGMPFILRHVDSGRKRRLFAVGACVGLSMLFKFPTAAIDSLGFALFLCIAEYGALLLSGRLLQNPISLRL